MNPTHLSEEPPPAGETLTADESLVEATPAAPALDEPIFRYDHVLDGHHVHTIARIATEYFDTRKPTGLHMERDQAKRFAETVRRHMEADPATYGAIPITRTTFHDAFERVIAGWVSVKSSTAD